MGVITIADCTSRRVVEEEKTKEKEKRRSEGINISDKRSRLEDERSWRCRDRIA